MSRSTDGRRSGPNRSSALRAEATGVARRRLAPADASTAAQLQVNGQGDQLDARLAGCQSLLPNPTPSAQSPSDPRGSIARWLTRAKPWFATGTWQIDGASEIAANVRRDKQRDRHHRHKNHRQQFASQQRRLVRQRTSRRIRRRRSLQPQPAKSPQTPRNSSRAPSPSPRKTCTTLPVTTASPN